jgi:hypothetical protein
MLATGNFFLGRLAEAGFVLHRSGSFGPGVSIAHIVNWREGSLAAILDYRRSRGASTR